MLGLYAERPDVVDIGDFKAELDAFESSIRIERAIATGVGRFSSLVMTNHTFFENACRHNIGDYVHVEIGNTQDRRFGKLKIIDKQIYPEKPFYSLPFNEVIPDAVEKNVEIIEIIPNHEAMGISFGSQLKDVHDKLESLRESLYILNRATQKEEHLYTIDDILFFRGSKGEIRIGVTKSIDGRYTFDYEFPSPNGTPISYPVVLKSSAIVEPIQKMDGTSIFMRILMYSRSSKSESRNTLDGISYIYSGATNLIHALKSAVKLTKADILNNKNLYDAFGIKSVNLDLSGIRQLNRSKALYDEFTKNGGGHHK